MKKFNFAEIEVFQYRKRYELHAISGRRLKQASQSCFNTASGMNCMQWASHALVYDPSAMFQYRKRYELHAINGFYFDELKPFLFQYRKRYGLHAIAT